MSGERDTVLFVNHTEYFGGSAASLLTLLRHLDRDVRRVLASPAGGRVAKTLEQSGLLDELVPLPALDQTKGRRRAIARAATRVARWARRHRHELAAIHANGLVEMLAAAPAAVLSRQPLIVWVHDNERESRRARRLVSVVDRITPRVTWAAVSEPGKQALIASDGAGSSRVTVVPNPIDPASVAAPRAVGRVPTVGYLGTDSVRKGFDLLPAIWRDVGPTDAHLVIYAKHHSGLTPDIEQTWQELGELVGVEIAGRLDDVRIAYARCDVVLCPSRAESFGRVVAESMLNGIPVVAADIPAFREVLGGDAGILFRPGDPRAAASAVAQLLADPARRVRLGEVGRGRAARYAPAEVAARFRALYFNRTVGHAPPARR